MKAPHPNWYTKITFRRNKALHSTKLLFIALAVSSTAFASSLTFTVTNSGTSEPTGSTVHFGYTITNNTSYFYQPTALNTGAFLTGSPTALFDYPEVAPKFPSPRKLLGLFGGHAQRNFRPRGHRRLRPHRRILLQRRRNHPRRPRAQPHRALFRHRLQRPRTRGSRPSAPRPRPVLPRHPQTDKMKTQFPLFSIIYRPLPIMTP